MYLLQFHTFFRFCCGICSGSAPPFHRSTYFDTTPRFSWDICINEDVLNEHDIYLTETFIYCNSYNFDLFWYFFWNLFGHWSTFPLHYLLCHNSSACSRYMYLRIFWIETMHNGYIYWMYLSQFSKILIYFSGICSGIAPPFHCTTYFVITLRLTQVIVFELQKYETKL